jgi:hypothetical protein
LQQAPGDHRAIQRARHRHGSCVTSRVMPDIIFIIATAGFFALAIIYTTACDRL